MTQEAKLLMWLIIVSALTCVIAAVFTGNFVILLPGLAVLALAPFILSGKKSGTRD